MRETAKPFLLAALCLVLALPAAAQAASGSDAALVPLGKTQFRVYCASCHGAGAEGDGRLAEYLTLKPADLTTISKRHDGEFPAERVAKIIDGREQVRGHAGDMPVWGDAFQRLDEMEGKTDTERDAEVERRIAALVAFLRSIQAE